jgi:hypothetical protein
VSSASSNTPESVLSLASSRSSDSPEIKKSKIAEGRRLLQAAIDSGEYSGLTKERLKAKFKDGYNLLIGNQRHSYKDYTTDDRLINLAEVNPERPDHLVDSQSLLIALIYPNFFRPLPNSKGGAASPSQLQPEPELQQIILKQVKPEYKLQQIILEPVKPDDKTFAEWRDAIYETYTEPNAVKREEYYSNLTPFAILIHVMVCCGLFGPLSSGKYIDVNESHPQYNRLNSIAAAFSTMNNGYISMTRMRLETMMPKGEALGNRTVSKVGPTVSKVGSNVEPTVAVGPIAKLMPPAINNEFSSPVLPVLPVLPVEANGGRQTRRKRLGRRRQTHRKGLGRRRQTRRQTHRKRFGQSNKRITRKAYKGFASKYKYNK